MSFEPNIELARETFARRVAEAYSKTWVAFGFIGPEFTDQVADELGKQAAQYAFPSILMPIFLKIDVNSEGVRNALSGLSRQFSLIQSGDGTFRYERVTPLAGTCGDGVSGE